MLSTRTKSPQRKLQEGQAIVLVALLILVLFAMLGLAIDSGRAYVDRRGQQAAVDAAALSAGDWYENYSDLTGATNGALPNSVNLYQNDLRLYGGPTGAPTHTFAMVGANNNLPQDTWTYTYSAGYTLVVQATNTQFNGYQFQYSSTHTLPLSFMQIFGGPTSSIIVATATAIVGNQRQTPALLTLSSQACATSLQGNGSLTMLGDAYTNGTECQSGSSSLDLAGNCYGGTGSSCSSAVYYCYNSTPGMVPYDPATTGGTCLPGDTQGGPVVPAPTLPDPGYLAPSVPFYSAAGTSINRGTYTEMTPGVWPSFSLSSSGCYFLDAGVYQWTGGYTSHGGFVSNELKSPNEELVRADFTGPGTTAMANPMFWPSGCAGAFTAAAISVPGGSGMKHGSGGGTWGIELTAVRFDPLNDTTITGGSAALCAGPTGCRRESAPSACWPVSTTYDVTGPQGINVNITQNSPGAQYYNVYIDPNGCNDPGGQNNFSYVNTFPAPGAPYPNGGSGTTLLGGTGGWPCGVATVTVCNVNYSSLSPTVQCFAQTRSTLCQMPDDEYPPQCITTCGSGLPQENAPQQLQYPPYTGGDVANENYCVVSPNPGDPAAPCQSARVTPGAVQFYFPVNQCLDQNANGVTHVFSGEQYNWIIIYEVLGTPTTCASGSQNTINGSAFTQYIGTIYSPSAQWTLSGTDTAPLAGQLITYSATVIGNNTTGILFNPNYSPAPPAARLIN
ncbi:MAG TPA: pilus assembly protein TadG-related protein [Candidatus Dormibacteraeota bacterium]|nr:pilus assembly protein TadG-related protein [Candidatus Dormibacteraeota bacterium]